MNKIKILLGFICLCAMLCTCQKAIDVKLPEYKNKLVVEGIIESGDFARVVITRSVPYFSEIDLNVLLNDVLVSDAVVTVETEDGQSEQLTFQYSEESPIYFAYVGKQIKGEYGKKYTLTIDTDGKHYEAKTSIPQPFELDSIWFVFSETNPQDTTPSIRALMTDNPLEANYYRFFVKVHGQRLSDRLWVSTVPMVFDDRTFNGQTLNYEVLRANVSTMFSPTMSDEELSEFYRLTYRPGDTVLVKHTTIDEDSYKFWLSASNEITFGQNPFMNPSPIVSGIKGENVIGVWSGYASKIDTLIYSKDSK
ncbi:MAG: DUF4249 domain-containing protein [Bacteroidales bacterium]|nr:DUF4249 domain-containing protein [Bacteroidales bacterium]